MFRIFKSLLKIFLLQLSISFSFILQLLLQMFIVQFEFNFDLRCLNKYLHMFPDLGLQLLDLSLIVILLVLEQCFFDQLQQIIQELFQTLWYVR